MFLFFTCTKFWANVVHCWTLPKSMQIILFDLYIPTECVTVLALPHPSAFFYFFFFILFPRYLQLMCTQWINLNLYCRKGTKQGCGVGCYRQIPISLLFLLPHFGRCTNPFGAMTPAAFLQTSWTLKGLTKRLSHLTL